MTQDNDEGISYLLALKGTASEAPAPAREATPETAARSVFSAQSSFEGTEKRRTPRYKCEGSAEICEIGCDVHTWASFTDVSLHGCYVEAQATYPVGTTLALKLQTNDRKFEVTGLVRVNYPYLGMGIAFMEMTDGDRSVLKDLLASMSRPMTIMGPGIASSLPASGTLESVPLISDPKVALQALLDFFEDRQMLMREDFLRILRQSQSQSQTAQSQP
jgi:PilZ domain